jgi:hypothetical protein
MRTRDAAARPRVARTLSFWLPGLGQLYNGDWLKGAGLLAASALLGARLDDEYPLASLLSCVVPVSPRRLAICAAALGVAWLWGIVDAHRSGLRRLADDRAATPRR